MNLVHPKGGERLIMTKKIHNSVFRVVFFYTGDRSRQKIKSREFIAVVFEFTGSNRPAAF